jgi:hypothetical protein
MHGRGPRPARLIILGAVAGIVWRERNLSFRAALKKIARDRRRAAHHQMLTG